MWRNKQRTEEIILERKNVKKDLFGMKNDLTLYDSSHLVFT